MEPGYPANPENQEQCEYFASYENLEVHRLMLEDDVRTNTYKKAILGCKSYFKDKVVMDVGCGTGILSIFCAQAGAKKVYAIEASNLVHLAREIVKENNFENVIEVIHNRVENVTLPNNIKVDAIVSEWMGFYLLHEGMLDSVLLARDMFLKDGGEIFPESAAIYAAPCSVPSLYTKYDEKYGVSMTSFSKQVRAMKFEVPEIMNVQSEDLLGEEVTFCWINLKTDQVADLDSYSMKHVVGAKTSGLYQGICLWFKCTFPQLSDVPDEGSIALDTSPHNLATHWKQTVIVFPNEIEIEEAEPIAFQIELNRDQVHSRRYNIQVTLLDPEIEDHTFPCSCYMTKCILIKTFMEQNSEHVISLYKKKNFNGLEDEDINDEELMKVE